MKTRRSLRAVVCLLLTFGLAVNSAQAIASSDKLDPSLLPYVSSLPFLTASNQPETQATTVTSSDIRITSDPAGMPQNEPSITVNPANSSILAAGANDYRLAAQGLDAWAGIYVSKNNGRTWSNGLLPGYPGGPTSVLTGFDTAGDPALAFDLQGNLYYGGIAFNRAGGGGVKDGTVFLAKSPNLGTTFTTVIVARGSGNTFNDKPYIAVDTTNSAFAGRVYVSWTQFRSTAGRILVSFSSDGGNTFSTPRVISDSSLNQGPIPAVGPNGEIYVVWRDIVNSQVKVAKSTNGGSGFSAPVVAANFVPVPNPFPGSSFRTNTNPALTVDPLTGTVYVAWNDYANGNADILLTRSLTGGASFTTPQKISDDATSNDQFFPWLKSVPGRVSAIFYDRRMDPSNHDLDAFYTDSTDQGITFTPNIRITDISFSPDVQFGGQFIGDYIGLALTQTDAYPAWTDTRNLNQDIFTERTITVPFHDIALTTATVPRRVGYNQINSNPLQVTITLANQGNAPENATVRLSILNGPEIGSRTLSIQPGTATSVAFAVSTQTLSKGNHTLVANAVPVPSETDTVDNSIDAGQIQVRFPGDIDNNGAVTIVDAAILALSFSKTCGSAGYLETADLDNDCDVDIIDAANLATFFGTIDP